jgi:hypothetical protein
VPAALVLHRQYLDQVHIILEAVAVLAKLAELVVLVGWAEVVQDRQQQDQIAEQMELLTPVAVVVQAATELAAIILLPQVDLEDLV